MPHHLENLVFLHKYLNLVNNWLEMGPSTCSFCLSLTSVLIKRPLLASRLIMQCVIEDCIGWSNLAAGGMAGGEVSLLHTLPQACFSSPSSAGLHQSPFLPELRAGFSDWQSVVSSSGYFLTGDFDMCRGRLQVWLGPRLMSPVEMSLSLVPRMWSLLVCQVLLIFKCRELYFSSVVELCYHKSL